MMVYIVILLYILFSIFVIFDSKLSNIFRSNNISSYIVWGILTCIATFRPDGMPDYESYYNFFTIGGSSRFEIGFVSYIEFFKLLSPNPTFLFAMVAMMSIGIKLSIIRKLTNAFWLSLIIYLPGIFILHDMIQIRAAVASGLLLWATKYIYDRDLGKFLITSIIAILFHNSALLILPLWFITCNKSHKLLYILLIPIAYALTIGGITIGHLAELIPIEAIRLSWQMYQISMENDIGTNINIYNSLHILRCIMCLFLLWNIDRISRYSKIAVLWVKIYVLSLALFVLMSDIPVIAFRVSELYQIVEILLIPTIILIPRYRSIGKYIGISFGFCILYINIFYTQLISHI